MRDYIIINIHNERLLVEDGFSQRHMDGLLKKQIETESVKNKKKFLGKRKTTIIQNRALVRKMDRMIANQEGSQRVRSKQRG